ncbi:MAG TPA: hypothetical protein VHP36_04245 [Chitinispirillaceae bacterium]|nr:hypothetical protein [Chitinispirillaceae bacterium]
MSLSMLTSIRYLFVDLISRSSTSELMDSPFCDQLMLLRTVHQFEYINFYLSGIRSLLKRTLVSHMKKEGRKSYTIIDLGSGGCDIPIWLFKTALQQSINLIIYCIEYNKIIASYAADKCKIFNGINIVVGNVFDVLKEYEADYVISNHFIHHLPDQIIIKLLKIVNSQSRNGFVINDLKRSRTSLFFFFLIGSVFFRNSFTLVDGLKSISRGFVADELLRYTNHSGINSVISDVKPGHICMYSLPEIT